MVFLFILLVILLTATTYIVYHSKDKTHSIKIAVLAALTVVTVTIIITISNNRSNKAYTNKLLDQTIEDTYINALKFNPYCPEITVKYININGVTKEIQRDTTYTTKFKYLK